MSSHPSRKPVYRLHLAYPEIVLTLDNVSEPLARASLEDADFPKQMAALADAARRGGSSLVVELPEAEVWRGTCDLRATRALTRGGAARRAAAARMGLAAREVIAVIGRRRSDRCAPVAAIRRATLAEARNFLKLHGIRRGSVVAAGAFPGFTAPPLFARLGMPALALPPLPRVAAPRRLAIGAACVAAALVLALRPQTVPEPDPASDVNFPVSTEQSVPQEAQAPLRLASPRPKPAPAVRPVAEPRQTRLSAPPPLSAPERPAATGVAPLITMTTRSWPGLAPQRQPDEPFMLKVAELGAARLRQSDAVFAVPPRRSLPDEAVRRPLTGAEAPLAVGVEAAAAGARRPLRRPDSARAPAAVIPAQSASDAAHARPRPRDAAAASRGLAKAIANAVVAAAVGPPAPRDLPVRTVRQTAPAKVPSVQPVPVEMASVQREPVKPATIRRSLAAPSKAAPAVTQSVGRVGKGISLIGVFGRSDSRHALLRLPSGTVYRVRRGDTVQGARVAAVGRDSVRLSGGGDDALLTMPD